MISFFCPYCKMPLKAEVEQANLLIDCVQCKLEVRVPPPATAPAAAIQPPQQVPQPESWWRRLLHRGAPL